jgi:hypothetical protein
MAWDRTVSYHKCDFTCDGDVKSSFIQLGWKPNKIEETKHLILLTMENENEQRLWHQCISTLGYTENDANHKSMAIPIGPNSPIDHHIRLAEREDMEVEWTPGFIVLSRR